MSSATSKRQEIDLKAMDPDKRAIAEALLARQPSRSDIDWIRNAGKVEQPSR